MATRNCSKNLSKRRNKSQAYVALQDIPLVDTKFDPIEKNEEWGKDFANAVQ